MLTMWTCLNSMNTKEDLRMGEDLTLFEDKQIRHIYDEEKEVYYFLL